MGYAISFGENTNALLLDENKTQHNDGGECVNSERCNEDLEEANASVDLMSSGLALLVQINETDRINILKEPISCYLFLRKCNSSYLVTYAKLFYLLMFAIPGSCVHIN